MIIPDALLPHKCIITQRRKTGKVDEYGNPEIAETTLPHITRCRFARRQCVQTEQGLDVITAECIIAPTQEIQEGDQIDTRNHPYTGRYWVQAMSAAAAPDNTDHHYKLNLRSVTP